jgi:hypothetical protein
VQDLHVTFSGNPQRTLDVPVTEVDIYRTHDEGAAETQERVRRLTYRVESLLMRGFIALSWGVAIEDGSKGVYIGGWRTIEVSSARSINIILVTTFDRFTRSFFYFFSFDRITCV